MYLNSLNKNVNITFIRNGITKLNFEDRIHGNVNTELTEEGVNEINNFQLENLNYDINLQDWKNKIAYTMWNKDEVSSGKTWEHLKSVYFK